MMLVIGIAVRSAALVAFRDAVRQRHVKTGDPQELVALARVAQPLGRTYTFKRFSSVPVTHCHGDIPVAECVKF